MIDNKYKTCIDCKRKLPATEEYFSKEKKGQYGFNNLCKDCQEQHRSCGIGSKWRKMGRNFYTFLLLVVLLSFTSCSDSFEKEISRFQNTQSSFTLINEILTEKSTGGDTSYLLIKNDAGMITRLSNYPDKVELNEEQLHALNQIASIFEEDFSFIEITSSRISYGGLGRDMYVYARDGKKPTYFYSQDGSVRGVRFSTHYIRDGWYLLERE